MFELISKGIFEMTHVIRNIDDVKKLLYYDTADALEKAVPSASQISDHIAIKPIYEVTNVAPGNKNSFITLNLDTLDVDDENLMISAVIRINIACNLSVWDNIPNIIRPLKIASLISDKVHNQKFSPSHKFIVLRTTSLVIDKQTSGYVILIGVYDASGDLEDEF